MSSMEGLLGHKEDAEWIGRQDRQWWAALRRRLPKTNAHQWLYAQGVSFGVLECMGHALKWDVPSLVTRLVMDHGVRLRADYWQGVTTLAALDAMGQWPWLSKPGAEANHWIARVVAPAFALGGRTIVEFATEVRAKYRGLQAPPGGINAPAPAPASSASSATASTISPSTALHQQTEPTIQEWLVLVAAFQAASVTKPLPALFADAVQARDYTLMTCLVALSVDWIPLQAVAAAANPPVHFDAVLLRAAAITANSVRPRLAHVACPT